VVYGGEMISHVDMTVSCDIDESGKQGGVSMYVLWIGNDVSDEILFTNSSVDWSLGGEGREGDISVSSALRVLKDKNVDSATSYSSSVPAYMSDINNASSQNLHHSRSLYTTTEDYYCDAYGSYYASDPSSTCLIWACGGSTITVSLSEMCSGDTYLNLVDGYGNWLTGNDDACAADSYLRYTIYGGTESCDYYYLQEGCYGSSYCGGQVHITVNSSSDGYYNHWDDDDKEHSSKIFLSYLKLLRWNSAATFNYFSNSFNIRIVDLNANDKERFGISSLVTYNFDTMSTSR
jgi:hypothetical protein